MPAEERHGQGSLADFEKTAQAEGEEAVEQQPNHNEHVGHGRREVTVQLPFGDGFDVLQRLLHGLCSFSPVSDQVMLRNTSSNRPSSVCNSSTFDPSFAVTSATLRARAPLALPSA